MRRPVWALAVVLVAGTALSAGVAAQKKDSSTKNTDAASFPEQIWRDPGDIASLDLFYGAGRKAHAPDPTGIFTFDKEDLSETSPKFSVTDGLGVAWKVKVGAEPQAETAATRFLWAAGYFVDEDYYIADLAVKGLPTLHRGQEFVSPAGIVHGARLERKLTSVTKLGDWDWFVNPFVGLRELNGLRVMMSLLNDWDLKATNNSIYAVDGERRYVVSDVGATFGNTGNSLTRSKGIPQDYADSRFVAKDAADFMDFVLHSRPFFTGIVEVSNYRERTRMEDITKHIPRADAQWLGERLARLTDNQIRDAFRAGGFGTDDVELLTRTIRLRIAALKAL